MKANKFKAKRRSSGEMSLNITAMADVFTVLLVFLLVGLSSGAVTIVPSAGITLPFASTEPVQIEALKLEISKSTVQVESKPVATLENYRYAAGDLAPDGTLKSLIDAIKIERQRQLALAAANPDIKLDSRVVLIADEKTPYSTIKAVLASAAVQGFTDFKLAVINK